MTLRLSDLQNLFQPIQISSFFQEKQPSEFKQQNATGATKSGNAACYVSFSAFYRPNAIK